MRNHHDLWGTAPGNNPPAFRCSVDPLTLTGLALGGLAGGAASMFGGGGESAPAPMAPPAQAPPQQKPQGKQNTQQPTFMGGIPTPPPSTGQKTLLGT